MKELETGKMGERDNQARGQGNRGAAVSRKKRHGG